MIPSSDQHLKELSWTLLCPKQNLNMVTLVGKVGAELGLWGRGSALIELH